MRLIFVKGRSLISRDIRWLTWGKYSHVALLFSDGTVIEAVWPRVRQLPLAAWKAQQDSPYDILKLDATAEEESLMRAFADKQVGKKYDILGDLKFITRPD